MEMGRWGAVSWFVGIMAGAGAGRVLYRGL